MTPISRLVRAVTSALACAAGLALSGCTTVPLSAEPAAPQGLAKPTAEKAYDKPAEKVAERRDSAGMVAPMVEKRETLTATGYAVVSVQNHRNPAQQRLMAIRAAKLDAYRSLTE